MDVAEPDGQVLRIQNGVFEAVEIQVAVADAVHLCEFHRITLSHIAFTPWESTLRAVSAMRIPRAMLRFWSRR